MAKGSKFRKVTAIGTKLFILTVLTVLALMMAGIIISIYRPAMEPIRYEATIPDYWPTNEWKTSTPLEQGMAPGKLVEMFDFE